MDANALPVPQHLRICTVATLIAARQPQYVGHVQCPCGCDTFEMQHAGGTYEWRGTIRTCSAEVDGKRFFRIVAKCAACGTEHLLFDKDLHGWNGFMCRQRLRGQPDSPPPLVAWRCQVCGEVSHKADVVIASMDKEEIIEESGGLFDDANWQEGFGWVAIDICCAACSHRHASWVSFETE